MKWKEGNTNFEKPPAGSWIGRLYSIVDLGTQKHTYQDRVGFSRDVRLSFELCGLTMEGIYDEKAKGKPFSVGRTVKQSLHAKARLRQLLKGWRGKDFTKEEINAFDPKKLLGKAARLTLIESTDGEYVDLDSLAPVGKDEKVPKMVNAPVFLSLEKGEFDQTIFDSLPEKTREKIKGSPEYAKLGLADDATHEPEPGEADDEPPVDDSEPF